MIETCDTKLFDTMVTLDTDRHELSNILLQILLICLLEYPFEQKSVS